MKKKMIQKQKAAFLLAACMMTSALPVSAEENSQDLVTLDIFINQSWWPVDTFTGIIPDAIKEATGVDLNVTVAADGNQLGLMVASNELPDLIFTDAETDRLSRPEACYSYNELLEQYAPDYKFDDLQVKIAKSFSSDDNYYTILGNYSGNEELETAPVPAGQAAWYYREDIYEELGSPKMETLDDLVDVCAMVKEKYPDMIPIATNQYYHLNIFSQFLGGSGGNTFQYLDDGSVVFKSDSPAYYEYLKFANELARKGYIDVENYASTNMEDTLQLAGNGGSFIYMNFLKPSNINDLNTRLQKTMPEAKFVVGPPLGEPGYACGKGWCGLFVSKSCKDPEAAIRFITYMFSEEGRRLSKWGREGVEWTMGEDGIPKWSEEWLSTLNNTEEMNSKYNQYFYFGATGIEDVMPDYGNVTPEEMVNFNKYREGFKNYPEIAIATPTSTSDEGVISKKLSDMLEAEEARVIFTADDEAFENAYQELQEKAEKIGVKELDEYMTKKVAEVKEEFGF